MLKIIRRSFANRASNNTYPCYVHRITRDCCTTDKLIIVDSLTLNPCPSHLLFSSPFRFHPSSNRIESLSSPSRRNSRRNFNSRRVPIEKSVADPIRKLGGTRHEAPIRCRLSARYRRAASTYEWAGS